MNPKDRAALNRVPLHLLPHVGRVHGAMACRDGAIKYGPYNWREKPISLMGYLGAMERHIAAIAGGEWCSTDTDPPVPHLGHIVATASILLDAHEAGTLMDDRPEKTVDVGSLMTTLKGWMESGEEARERSRGR